MPEEVEMVEAVLNGEYKITLPNHRAQRPEWYTEQGWEKARMQALVYAIRRAKWNGVKLPIDTGAPPTHKPVIYYIGAEEGELAAICAMQGAQMFLFEPNPKAWPNIKAIWEANGLDTPVCFPGFASNETAKMGKEWGYTLTKSWPTCALDEVVGNHGFKELYLEADNYPQVRVDDVWQEHECYKPPDIIAFDIEGSEWRMLEGAKETLEQHKPVLFASIHPEFMYAQWGEYSGDLRRWIKDFGYKETILDYQHELHTMYTPL